MAKKQKLYNKKQKKYAIENKIKDKMKLDLKTQILSDVIVENFLRASPLI